MSGLIRDMQQEAEERNLVPVYADDLIMWRDRLIEPSTRGSPEEQTMFQAAMAALDCCIAILRPSPSVRDRVDRLLENRRR